LAEPRSGEAILVDANLVMWAHHAQMPDHERARAWWSQALTETPLVGVPWPTILAFIRLSTHPRVLERPITVETAWAVVDGWLDRPNTRCPVPTERHAALFRELLLDARATGNHAPDAHLAALSIEWGLELMSADGDFARYRGLRWRNPIASATA
jgi:toxin-antitoxin system PIN domain toxin